MAIGTPVDRGILQGTTSPQTTGSFTAGTGDLLVAIVAVRQSSGVPAKGTASDTQSLVWTERGDYSYDTGVNPRIRVTVYTAVGNGAAQTVTGASSNCNALSLQVISIPGAGAPGANNGYATDTAGDPSVTISAVAGTSAIIGGFYGAGTNNPTDPTGYTVLSTISSGPSLRFESYYDISSPATTVNVTSTNTYSIIWAMEFPEASAGGTNALTATGVSSASVVANPALGQTHALTVAGVSSADTVAAPALGQTQALTATGVSSATVVANPALGQKQALTITGVSSASFVGTPTVGTTGTLTAIGVSSATVVAQPALGQVHALTVTGVSSATTVAQPALGYVHVLTANGVSSASSVATPIIGTTSTLAATGVSSASSVANPTLGQKHAIVTPGVTSSSFVGTPALGQKHVFAAPPALTSASKVDTPALASIFSLGALGIKSDIFVATPALHQKHALSAISIYSDTFVGQPNIPVAGAGLNKVTRKKPYRYIPIQHPDKNLDSLHQVVVQLKLVMEMVQNTLKDSDNG